MSREIDVALASSRPIRAALRMIETAPNQEAVAILYCELMLVVPPSDESTWPLVNLAVRARWPKGLERVKRRAWQLRAMRERTERVKALGVAAPGGAG